MQTMLLFLNLALSPLMYLSGTSILKKEPSEIYASCLAGRLYKTFAKCSTFTLQIIYVENFLKIMKRKDGCKAALGLATSWGWIKSLTGK